MSCFNLNDFTKEMSRSPLTQTLAQLWGNTTERWDVASTGCVANITPIIGYLWLMVAAKDNQNMYVTKLPSKGGSCGTVDILESGGFSFPTDAKAIVNQCKNEKGVKGVICQPTDGLAPVDKVLFDARRLANLVTNFPLVYASILSKRIAIGCTHCIIDVKIGKDTKMFSPLMDENLLKLVRNISDNEGEQKLVIDDKKVLAKFQYILSQMLADSKTLDSKTLELKDNYIQQNCQYDSLAQLKQVRWLLTNSGMPQCRAIGRHLILIHLDRILTQDNDKKDKDKQDDLLSSNEDNEYKTLYMKVLPEICGVKPENIKFDKLQEEWKNLRKNLPKFQTTFNVEKYLNNQDYSKLEISYGDQNKDLRIISFGLYPYKLEAYKKAVTIKKMDAYQLDQLFGWLSGGDTYDHDPEVGIWLHKLPGESVEIKDEKIISIFYRPSRCKEAEVIAKVRDFLCSIEV